MILFGLKTPVTAFWSLVRLDICQSRPKKYYAAPYKAHYSKGPAEILPFSPLTRLKVLLYSLDHFFAGRYRPCRLTETCYSRRAKRGKALFVVKNAGVVLQKQCFRQSRVFQPEPRGRYDLQRPGRKNTLNFSLENGRHGMR